MANTLTVHDSTVTIYPKLPSGESIKVTMPRFDIRITHASGVITTITYYCHRKRWLWRDSRDGRCTQAQALREVGRMMRLTDPVPILNDYLRLYGAAIL